MDTHSFFCCASSGDGDRDGDHGCSGSTGDGSRDGDITCGGGAKNCDPGRDESGDGVTDSQLCFGTPSESTWDGF